MPERTEYTHGTPSWVDLQTPDQNAAKQFYGEVFGWSYDDAPMGDGGEVYSMAQLRGRNVAAIAPHNMEGVPPHWNCYVTVDDVDASAAAVPGAGGQVFMPPFDVMDAGRMAVVADPTGAVIQLWTAKNNIGAQIVNETGAFGWIELLTPDVEKAGAFYNAILGWEVAPSNLEGMEYTEFKVDGQSIAGGMKPPMPGIPPVWTVYFMVDDTDAATAKAQSLGASVIAPPTDIPPGRFAVIADPQGAMFNIIKMAEM